MVKNVKNCKYLWKLDVPGTCMYIENILIVCIAYSKREAISTDVEN